MQTVVLRQAEDAPALSCVVHGDAPRVLFVHGANASAAVWAPLMEAMALLGESCIAVDLRGHGQSLGRAELQSYRIRDYVEDVCHVLHCYPSIRVVVGHSMGGLIGQLVASETTIGHLVLVASAPVGGMLKDGVRMFLRHPISFLAVFFRRSFGRLYKNREAARSLLFHPDTPDSVVDPCLANLQEESWRAGIEMIWLLPKPSDVRCSVSVVGGRCDAMVSPSSVRATARAYGVVPLFVERAAHMVPVEAEPQSLAELIIDCAGTGAS